MCSTPLRTKLCKLNLLQVEIINTTSSCLFASDSHTFISCHQHVKSSLSSRPLTGSFGGRTGYIFSSLSCGQVISVAFVIGLHGNICCPNNTGRVIFMSNLSSCLIKIFVHLMHCLPCVIKRKKKHNKTIIFIYLL